MNTQHNAVHMLRSIQEHKDELARLESLRPILEKAAAGLPIQFKGTDGGWLDTRDAAFCAEPERYRVKPTTVRARRFWFQPTAHAGMAATGPIIQVVLFEADQREPRERWQGFRGWIDTDWQTFEVPE